MRPRARARTAPVSRPPGHGHPLARPSSRPLDQHRPDAGQDRPDTGRDGADAGRGDGAARQRYDSARIVARFPG